MDDGEIEEKLLLYMNDLMKGLKLNHPSCKNVDDIQISTLVEINCRLNGLNFNDYIPSLDKPWEDVQGIIFTLQERFGNEKFRHLSARRIAAHKPLHLACLLQILHTIYEHGRKKGRKFLPPSANVQDTTILDEFALPDDDEKEFEVSDNDSGTTVDELKFNFILEDTESERTNVSEDSAINSGDLQAFESSFDSDHSSPREKESGNHKDTRAGSIGGKTLEQSSSASQNQFNKKKRFPHSSTPKKVERKQMNQVIPFDACPMTSIPNTSHAESSKATRIAKPASSKVLAVGTIFEKERFEETEKKENEPPPEDTSIEDFAARAISQLHKLRAEIENRVHKQMTDTLNQVDQVDHRETGAEVEYAKLKPAPCKQRNVTSNGFAGVGPIKHDHSGKPYRERFPYYPGGIIKVQCHASSKKRLPPPDRHGHVFGYETSKSVANYNSEKKQKEMRTHMLNLQKRYNDELESLRKRFGVLVKKGGPKAFDRIRAAWTESYHRLRKEAAKAVDSIIKAAETMDAEN